MKPTEFDDHFKAIAKEVKRLSKFREYDPQTRQCTRIGIVDASISRDQYNAAFNLLLRNFDIDPTVALKMAHYLRQQFPVRKLQKHSFQLQAFQVHLLQGDGHSVQAARDLATKRLNRLRLVFSGHQFTPQEYTSPPPSSSKGVPSDEAKSVAAQSGVQLADSPVQTGRVVSVAYA
eukprot:NODE_4702_length_752_cov_42.856000_g4542_i0.p1 GENE.NODE_4702_length_752_cov_42.856000_g4542_i0~~NODE_4702_length_752_cov_42.856000_g4542_i0.p1  ORF type:complete len:176 (+),score=53.03 NODE_4702_length_752_cov_42.856000_g4542_i0:64-591(+)